MFACVCLCLHVFACVCLGVFGCVFADSSPTCAPELLAFNLADAFVSQPSGVAAARSAGLDRVVKQVVCQPLEVTVTHKGILGQMTEREGGERRRWVCHGNRKRRGLQLPQL